MFHYLSRSRKSRQNIADSLTTMREDILNNTIIPDNGDYLYLRSPQMYEYMGLSLPNRVGLGAGFDINGEYIDQIGYLGFGFIEIGTITPEPHHDEIADNVRSAFYRYPAHPSTRGIDYTIQHLQKSRYLAAGGILGINIGHNKNTSRSALSQDYEECIFKCYDYASYFVINIDQFDYEHQGIWDHVLQHLKKIQLKLATQKKKYVPLLIKIRGNFSERELIDLCHMSTDLYLDGIITTGSVLDSDTSPALYSCGQEIQERSERILRQVIGKTSPSNLCILSSGGIVEENDVAMRFQMGADLVQIMSSFLQKKQDFLTACLAQSGRSTL